MVRNNTRGALKGEGRRSVLFSFLGRCAFPPPCVLPVRPARGHAATKADETGLSISLQLSSPPEQLVTSSETELKLVTQGCGCH